MLNERFIYNIDGRNIKKKNILDTIVENRGIDDLESYINPQCIELLTDTDELLNMKKAYNILDESIILGDKILILADVDVDGLSSAAIMARCLKRSGGRVGVTINSGKNHGLSNFDFSILNGYSTLVIVDSIDNDVSLYQKIIDMGIRIVVFDHHVISNELLDYANQTQKLVIVSSANQYKNPALSGAGVCLKYALFMDEMDDTNYANDLFVFAAMGIVADMCDMSVMENRFIVSRGLSQKNNKLVKEIVGSFPFNSTAISFSIAPLVNAAIRMNHNEDVLRVFLSDDDAEIKQGIESLKQYREDQNLLIERNYKEIIEQVESQSDKPCLFVMMDNLPDEFTGLMANKVMGSYKRPVFCLKKHGDCFSGSMRSMNCGNMLQLCNETNLATCNGHEESAGISIPVESYEAFKEEICKVINSCSSNVVERMADILLDTSQLTDKLVKDIMEFDEVSGNNSPAIKIMVDLDDYEVGNMSSGKHSKFTDNKTGILVVIWNDFLWKNIDKHKTLRVIGTVSSAIYGRKRYIQLVGENYELI